MKKILLMVAIAASLSGCWEMGNGEKIGMVTKLAKQGAFCPTWEAEIVRGGFTGGSGVSGQSFHFTVTDDATAKQIQDAMEGQKEVKITYRVEGITFCRSDSNGHFLKTVEVLDPKAGPVAADGTTSQDAKIAALVRQLIKEAAQ